MQQLAGEVGDVFGEGCREQQVLTLGRQAREDFLHVVHETHVEHAVGFVEDEDFHVAEVDGLLVGQVEQTAGAGDQHVDALGERLDLRVHADATEDAGAFQRYIAGVQLEAVVHLGGQLAGRSQYQHARLARGMAVFAVGMAARKQQFEHRQGEAAGLAGAGLRGDHQVAALQDGGNGALLHRGRLGVAGGLDGASQGLGETEGSKGHAGFLFHVGNPPTRGGSARQLAGGSRAHHHRLRTGRRSDLRPRPTATALRWVVVWTEVRSIVSRKARPQRGSLRLFQIARLGSAWFRV
ncbi:hypothetical protein D3C85_670610 [compost metagenome]